MPQSLKSALGALTVIIGALIGTPVAPAANLVNNGGFEHFNTGWVGYDISFGTAAAEGMRYATIGSPLYQDLQTVAGEIYYVRYSVRNSGLSVSFGSQPVAVINASTNQGTFSQWITVEGHMAASSGVTRLEFTGAGSLDDVQVIASNEPVAIVSQPASVAAIQQGAASFQVAASGCPPLTFHWRHNGNPVQVGRSPVLYITNVNEASAGSYSVSASNSFGVASSDAATLSVDQLPTTPVFVRQPVGDVWPAGYPITVSASAIGAPPLAYQWLRNGTNIPGATNYFLTIASVQMADEGSYSVRAQNSAGSALSLPAVIAVTNLSGGGYVSFDNVGPTVRQPISDYDGTKLSGTNFLAQLYVGTSPETLRPLGTPKPFLMPPLAGFFRGGPMQIPDATANTTVYVQTRVWQAGAGVSYEDARARGGRYGVSKCYALTAVPPPPAVPLPVPMDSFSLKAGSPLFTTGKLSANSRGPQGVEWQLTGAADARYLIEKRSPPQNWSPLLVVTNTSGTTLFRDTNSGSAALNFYRARMLD